MVNFRTSGPAEARQLYRRFFQQSICRESDDCGAVSSKPFPYFFYKTYGNLPENAI